MIALLENFNNQKLSTNSFEGINWFTIYSCERLYLEPTSMNSIVLPYKRTNFSRYINFTLSKDLSKLGLSCVWNNLNEESAKKSLTFLIKNNNIVLDQYLNPIARIVGTLNIIDVIPGSEFGRIYF